MAAYRGVTEPDRPWGWRKRSSIHPIPSSWSQYRHNLFKITLTHINCTTEDSDPMILCLFVRSHETGESCAPSATLPRNMNSNLYFCNEYTPRLRSLVARCSHDNGAVPSHQPRLSSSCRLCIPLGLQVAPHAAYSIWKSALEKPSQVSVLWKRRRRLAPT